MVKVATSLRNCTIPKFLSFNSNPEGPFCRPNDSLSPFIKIKYIFIRHSDFVCVLWISLKFVTSKNPLCNYGNSVLAGISSNGSCVALTIVDV